MGHNPVFFHRLRSWLRQTFILDFQVVELLGPAPVLAKEQETKLINTPAPFTRSAKRAPAIATCTVSPNPTWMDMKAITNVRRLRRRNGWYDLKKAKRTQSREETTGLLAAAEFS